MSLKEIFAYTIIIYKFWKRTKMVAEKYWEFIICYMTKKIVVFFSIYLQRKENSNKNWIDWRVNDTFIFFLINRLNHI